MVGYASYRVRCTAISNSFVYICNNVYAAFNDDEFERSLGLEQLLELQTYLCYVAGKIESEDEFTANLVQILDSLNARVRRNSFIRGVHCYVDFQTNEGYFRFFYI